ncbi:hypothetical protein KJ632_04060 [Patescibacteria group bacterium]|nr:hypothetical protein [Patescibacteria group bacterium]
MTNEDNNENLGLGAAESMEGSSYADNSVDHESESTKTAALEVLNTRTEAAKKTLEGIFALPVFNEMTAGMKTRLIQLFAKEAEKMEKDKSSYFNSSRIVQGTFMFGIHTIKPGTVDSIVNSLLGYVVGSPRSRMISGLNRALKNITTEATAREIASKLN